LGLVSRSAGAQAVTDIRDYLERANRHAPQSADELCQAARQMLRDGLSDHGVAAALGIDVTAVRRLIAECNGCNE
jgi:metal-dependent amidase/aminoacylase/carboxypeptidase family protein